MQYTVQQGDTLYSLARRYRLTVEQLAAANQISPEAELTPGEIITIPTIEPVDQPGSSNDNAYQPDTGGSNNGNLGGGGSNNRPGNGNNRPGGGSNRPGNGNNRPGGGSNRPGNGNNRYTYIYSTAPAAEITAVLFLLFPGLGLAEALRASPAAAGRQFPPCLPIRLRSIFVRCCVPAAGAQSYCCCKDFCGPEAIITVRRMVFSMLVCSKDCVCSSRITEFTPPVSPVAGPGICWGSPVVRHPRLTTVCRPALVFPGVSDRPSIRTAESIGRISPFRLCFLKPMLPVIP